MNDIISIAESIGFTPKDRKAIDAARQETAEINQTINKVLYDPSHAPSESYFGWLHLEVDRLEQVVIDNPSHENAERLHAAIVRFNSAKDTQQRIGGALGIAAQKVSQSVVGTVQGHLGKVEQRIQKEADLRRAELKPSNHALFSNADEKRALEARVATLLADLANERTEASTDPLGWIERNGLALDDQPVQADTEAA